MSPNARSVSVAYITKDKTRGLEDIDSIDGSKIPQDQADYRPPGNRCHACRFFDGVDACSKVDGPIAPDGNSKYFEARAAAPGEERVIEIEAEEEE